MGDSLEALNDIFSICIEEESQLLQRKHRASQKALKMKKKDRFDLPYTECLQETVVFKTFGFRTLQTTACLRCKYTSRKMHFNLHFDVPVQIGPHFDALSPQAASMFFDS